METGRTCDEKTLNSNSSGVETWRWQKKAQKMKKIMEGYIHNQPRTGHQMEGSTGIDWRQNTVVRKFSNLEYRVTILQTCSNLSRLYSLTVSSFWHWIQTTSSPEFNLHKNSIKNFKITAVELQNNNFQIQYKQWKLTGISSNSSIHWLWLDCKVTLTL